MSRPALLGFTLIETIVYIALLAMGLATLTFVHISSLETHSIISNEQALIEAKRVAELTIRSRLEESGGVTTPASGSDSQLIIESPTASENPVIFTVTNGVLTMKLGNASPVSITPANVRVTAFTATRLSGSPPSVRLSLTYEAEAFNATISSTSTFTVTLRYE